MNIESEEFLQALSDAPPKQIFELVESMKHLTVLLGNEAVEKLLVRKFEKRLEVVEKNTGVHSSSTGESKWPTLTKQIT